MAASIESIGPADLAGYLGIDYAGDEMVAGQLARACAVGNRRAAGVFGSGADGGDPAVREYALAVAADAYDNRQLVTESGGSKASNAQRALLHDLALQAILEARE